MRRNAAQIAEKAKQRRLSTLLSGRVPLLSDLLASIAHVFLEENEDDDDGCSDQGQQKQPSPVLAWVTKDADDVASVELGEEGNDGIAQGAPGKNDAEEF